VTTRQPGGGPFITKDNALMKVTQGKGVELCYVHGCQNKPNKIIVWFKRPDKAKVWVCNTHGQMFG
jgi:hypothetical protein